MDSVTPASNSVMAYVLKKLGLLYDDAALHRYFGAAFSQCGSADKQDTVHHFLTGEFYCWTKYLVLIEVAITGERAQEIRIELEKNYVPNKIVLGGKRGSLPLLQDKFAAATRIFICKDKTCGLPTENIEEALKQIRN